MDNESKNKSENKNRKAKAKAINEYRKRNYAIINLQLTKENKNKLIAYAKENGYKNLTEYIFHAIETESGIDCKLKKSLPWITEGKAERHDS